MASFDKLKKYQRKKFKRYKELNDIKTKNDEAYIVVKVKDIDSILSEYSSEERPTLNSEFLDLIERKASFIPLDLPLVLEIHNNTFTSDEKILIRKLIKNYFDLKRVETEIEEHSMSRKGRFLLTSGILCTCVIPFIWNNLKISFFTEVLSVIAAFSFWEFAGLMIFDYDKLRETIIKYNHLAKVRIIYIE